jgi:hypothetical protein
MADSIAEVNFRSGRRLGLPASSHSITSNSIPWRTIPRSSFHSSGVQRATGSVPTIAMARLNQNEKRAEG